MIIQAQVKTPTFGSYVVVVLRLVNGFTVAVVVAGAAVTAVIAPGSVSVLVVAVVVALAVVAGCPSEAPNVGSVLVAGAPKVGRAVAAPVGMENPEKAGGAPAPAWPRAASPAETLVVVAGAEATAAAGAPIPKAGAAAGVPNEKPDEGPDGVAVKLKAGGAAPGAAGVDWICPNVRPPGTAGFAVNDWYFLTTDCMGTVKIHTGWGSECKADGLVVVSHFCEIMKQ